MKTKILKIFLIIFFIFVNSILKAETIVFDSKNIKIEDDGYMIFATNGVAKIPSKNLRIEGDKFVYDKKNSELIIFDNVKYIDLDNNITIDSQKIVYNEFENKVFSQSETYLELENNYEIKSTNVLFDRKLKKISS